MFIKHVVNDCCNRLEIMALLTHPVQSSYATFPSRPVSHKKVIELKQSATTLSLVVNSDRLLALRCKSCLSVGAPLIWGPKVKSLRIAAFKESANNDEAGGSESTSARHTDKISYVQAENKNTFTESPELSYTSEVERMSGSQAIQNLLKFWLALLHTPSPPPSEAVDETLQALDPVKISVVQFAMPIDRGNIKKTLWDYFWGLDAAVKIPLLLFLPLYLAVNVAYGAGVSKELIPLWIFGPLIIALYVKILRGICALYVFSFKQAVKVIKISPTYAVIVYMYIVRGKLKEDIHSRLWIPVLHVKKKDYKEFMVRKTKELQVWATVKYLDFVESVWPTYCRMTRFLKRSNFV